MPGSRNTWLFAAVAFLAALAGVLIGRSISERQQPQASALHQLLHEELDLSERQLARIEELESRFSIRRGALHSELRMENAKLAAAIQAERGYGPRVTAEVDRSHRVMGELQKETLSHIFAMRAVLEPKQAEKLDRAVVKALTADAR